MGKPIRSTALMETHFGKLQDPRELHSIDHSLDILVIKICETICGADDWEALVEYGKLKQGWLKIFAYVL